MSGKQNDNVDDDEPEGAVVRDILPPIPPVAGDVDVVDDEEKDIMIETAAASSTPEEVAMAEEERGGGGEVEEVEEEVPALPVIFLRGLSILPPRQKKKEKKHDDQDDDEGTTESTFEGVALPPLRPEEPVASLRDRTMKPRLRDKDRVRVWRGRWNRPRRLCRSGTCPARKCLPHNRAPRCPRSSRPCPRARK